MSSLTEILSNNKKHILRAWFDRIAATYPNNTEKFIKTKKNAFANPIGSSMQDGFEPLFDWLLKNTDEGDQDGELLSAIERVVKVRAIQEFDSAGAVGFIFELKPIIRKLIKESDHKSELTDELLTLESKIDLLALRTFDCYVKCREKIFEFRANELKNATSRLVQRACQVWDRKNRTKKDNDESKNPITSEVSEDESI